MTFDSIVELFKNNLYFDLAEHANKMAYKLSDSLKELGYEFLTEPTSNQIFPIMDNKIIVLYTVVDSNIDYEYNIEMSDETYFSSKYGKYVSNSGLKNIDAKTISRKLPKALSMADREPLSLETPM